MKLLAQARKTNYRLGLATMSCCRQAHWMLEILEMEEVFDVVASRDDVEQGKTDPEIYLLVAKEMEVDMGSCLMIEEPVTEV